MPFSVNLFEYLRSPGGPLTPTLGDLRPGGVSGGFTTHFDETPWRTLKSQASGPTQSGETPSANSKLEKAWKSFGTALGRLRESFLQSLLQVREQQLWGQHRNLPLWHAHAHPSRPSARQCQAFPTWGGTWDPMGHKGCLFPGICLWIWQDRVWGRRGLVGPFWTQFIKPLFPEAPYICVYLKFVLFNCSGWRICRAGRAWTCVTPRCWCAVLDHTIHDRSHCRYLWSYFWVRLGSSMAQMRCDLVRVRPPTLDSLLWTWRPIY